MESAARRRSVELSGKRILEVQRIRFDAGAGGQKADAAAAADKLAEIARVGLELRAVGELGAMIQWLHDIQRPDAALEIERLRLTPRSRARDGRVSADLRLRQWARIGEKPTP